MKPQKRQSKSQPRFLTAEGAWVFMDKTKVAGTSSPTGFSTEEKMDAGSKDTIFS